MSAWTTEEQTDGTRQPQSAEAAEPGGGPDSRQPCRKPGGCCCARRTRRGNGRLGRDRKGAYQCGQDFAGYPDAGPEKPRSVAARKLFADRAADAAVSGRDLQRLQQKGSSPKSVKACAHWGLLDPPWIRSPKPSPLISAWQKVREGKPTISRPTLAAPVSPRAGPSCADEMGGRDGRAP